MRLCVVLLSCCLIFIWGNSLLPGEISGAISDFVKNILAAIFEQGKPEPENSGFLLRKLAHFSEYAVLGWLLTGSLYRAKSFLLLKPLAAGLFLALCDETLQLFVAGRGSQVQDIWIDLAGVTAGTLILWLYYRLRKR